MSRLACLSLLLVIPCSGHAQDDNPFETATPKSFEEVATLSAEIVPAKAKRGETVTYKVTVVPRKGAWTYPIKPKDDSQVAKNGIGLPKPGDLIFVDNIVDPPGLKEKPREEAPGKKDEYYPASVTWTLTAIVSPTATPGKKTIVLDKYRTRIQACTDSNCYRSTQPLSASFEVLDGEPVAVDTRYADLVGATAISPPAVKPTSPPPSSITDMPAPADAETAGKKIAKPIEQIKAELDSIAKVLDKAPVNPTAREGVGAFLLTAAAWGLISLVTPCVFPMIPITVSIFLKQAHGSLSARLKLAGVYCLTIITVLGISAFALLKFMAWLSNHPITNVLLGLLFFVLALSLFGMYELTLPNVISKRLQTKQQQGGVVGTIFGALAFTVISFTCVAPFLGGFAGISAADSGGSLIAVPTAREVFGGLAFATAFAAPFFILALVPGLLKSLPRSGGWLDSVKVVMGFLELAAALKFFRTAELGTFEQPYFSFDLVLAGWVAISLACGLYLLNLYRLPHDEERPSIAVPRLLFGVMFLGFALYIMPGLFKTADGKNQRPKGAIYAWVDAFLLPEQSFDHTWGTDLAVALEHSRREAKQTGHFKPIFIDFTGIRCTNCSINESNVFTLPSVLAEFKRYEKVQLFTDFLADNRYIIDPGETARNLEGDLNNDFKTAAFETAQLPLYVVVVPTTDGKVKVLGVYNEGKINDPARFVKFLRDAAEQAKR